jgi:hypothetical protein
LHLLLRWLCSQMLDPPYSLHFLPTSFPHSPLPLESPKVGGIASDAKDAVSVATPALLAFRL